jgi:hypothetical protein
MVTPHSTSSRLTVTFVRKAGSPDHVYVRRPDGSETGWSFPSYGDGLPHDLVHLVVESHFGLRDGFWGRVASGVDAARINADANRRGGKDKYSGFGDDLSELYLAEALANARWLDSQATDDERLEDIARECTKAGSRSRRRSRSRRSRACARSSRSSRDAGRGSYREERSR